MLLERILKERREKWEDEQLEMFDAKGKVRKDGKWKEKYKEPDIAEISEILDLPEEWRLVNGDTVFWFVTSGSRRWAKYYSDSGSLFLRIGNLGHDAISLDLEEVRKVTPRARRYSHKRSFLKG